MSRDYCEISTIGQLGDQLRLMHEWGHEPEAIDCNKNKFISGSVVLTTRTNAESQMLRKQVEELRGELTNT